MYLGFLGPHAMAGLLATFTRQATTLVTRHLRNSICVTPVRVYREQ